jgi:lysophospholipase L1-like esterase
MRERFTRRAALQALAGLAAGLALAWLALNADQWTRLLPTPGPPPTVTPTSFLPDPFPSRSLSLGVPVRASSGEVSAAAVVDGVWRTWAGWRPATPTAAAPQWLALDLGRPAPAAILLLWNAGNNTNYTETRYGGLGSYTVETSADSTDGSDGTWRQAAAVSGNSVRTRAHRVPFAGQRWVRLVVTALAPGATEAALDEVAVYDAAGLNESWLFLGDSLSAVAFDRAAERGPAFADLVHARRPESEPITLDAGVSGETSAAALARLDAVLATNPDFHFWVLGYGTNDVPSDPGGLAAAAFAGRIGRLAARIQAAGHVPVVAPIPYSRDPAHRAIPQYNAALLALADSQGWLVGPDLYGYFAAHPDQLGPDGIHPTDTGSAAINRLWAAWRLKTAIEGKP